MTRRQTSTTGLELTFFAIGSAALILAVLLHAVAAKAESATFVDIPAGAYYADSAAALLDSGALESATYLRPSDFATRAEMMKMLVLLNDETLTYPTSPNFKDVSKTAWYYTYLETAAKAGWVKGDNNCYQRSIPCYGRPEGNLNRAEAATLLARAFNLQPLALAPRFADVSVNDWYDQTIQAAADRCILQGDANSDRVRPGALMNRAEMITMFHRAQQSLRYGQDCGTAAPALRDVSVSDETHLTVVFNANVAKTRAEDIARYTLTSVATGVHTGIDSVTKLSDNTVQVRLSSPLVDNTRYTLDVSQLSTDGGTFFSDSFSFTSPSAIQQARISSVSGVSTSQIQLTFSEDLSRGQAEDSSHYQIVRQSNSGSVAVSSAVLVDSRHVLLSLNSSLQAGSAYSVNVTNLRTAAGSNFNDSYGFSAVGEQPVILSVVPVSNMRVRVNFNVDMSQTLLGETAHYILSNSGGTLTVNSVSNVTDRSADINLSTPLEPQSPYRLRVSGLTTSQGVSFSDAEYFIFSMQNVSMRSTLNGSSEVPATVSTATGTGSFTLQADGLHYDITVQNLNSTITDAHLHLGAPGVAGPVVYGLTFSGNHASGVWSNLTTDQRNAILNGNIYVNVHTTTYPNGEIRGQVLAL